MTLDCQVSEVRGTWQPSNSGIACIYKYVLQYAVSNFQFEWDPAKNLTNQRKHGVSFEEAAQVFRNPLYLSWKDRVQDGEERWQACGEVEGLALLIVAHTIREEQEDGNEIEVVRIISARQAEPQERRRYEKENG